MKSNVQISRGIESLFGTRDENIRLIEDGLKVRTRLLNDSLEIEGDEAGVSRAERILERRRRAPDPQLSVSRGLDRDLLAGVQPDLLECCDRDRDLVLRRDPRHAFTLPVKS